MATAGRLMKIVSVIRYACFFGALWAICGDVRASDIPGYPEWDAFDPREIALLPQYCKYTLTYREHVRGGNNKAEIEKWEAIMGRRQDAPGPVFDAMHHYCNAIVKTNRALVLARSEQVKIHYLSSSIPEFDYVLERAPASFVLLPEILTKKGENLIRLGRGAAGVLELERAIDLKSNYWPPYAALSDYYMRVGDLAKARQWLQKGLNFSPDAKPLQRRLSELQKASVKAKD
jgi:tetratricopeptide (TPR) repeat protein